MGLNKADIMDAGGVAGSVPVHRRASHLLPEEIGQRGARLDEVLM